ncbi:hypothetical protein B484DRAFT_292878 [Ochromonadaceae sp. CCMP2298]|nr:hypothetical protein B484DRAFT_292878 [Ochromonadaceae sp. CCMP2298]
MYIHRLSIIILHLILLNLPLLRGGAYRLLEMYDVLPVTLSKVEAKVLFALSLHAQRNLRTPASIAGGGTGLDFTSFLKFLVLVAYHALSKTSSYSSTYATMEAKVEALLVRWGLGDGVKLGVVAGAVGTVGRW